MLQYEVVTLPAKKVAGLKIRTGDAHRACLDKIARLW